MCSPFGKFRLKGVVPTEQLKMIGKDLLALGKDRLIYENPEIATLRSQ